MRNFLITIGLALAAVVTAQEPTLRISVREPTFRFELGTTVYKLTNLFSQDWFDVDVKASVGSLVEEGELVGAFSALLPLQIGDNFAIAFGPEYRGQKDKRSVFDGVVEFRVGNKNQTFAFNSQAFVYSCRF